MIGVGTGPGACPVCGTAHSACVGPTTHVVHQQAGVKYPWRSRERVIEMTSPDGGRVKYGVGAPIPLWEAMRQGIVQPSEVTAEQMTELRTHPTELKAVLKEIRERRNKAVLRPAGTKA